MRTKGLTQAYLTSLFTGDGGRAEATVCCSATCLHTCVRENTKFGREFGIDGVRVIATQKLCYAGECERASGYFP